MKGKRGLKNINNTKKWMKIMTVHCLREKKGDGKREKKEKNTTNRQYLGQ